jgi:hypothetical protein
MSNIHVSLVGGQSLPVYKTALSMKPDKVILICSKQTRGTASTIQKLLAQKIDAEFKIKIFETDDLDLIKKEIDNLVEDIHDDDDVVVNVTGGIKTWSILFYREFSNLRYQCIYVDQNDKVWDLTSSERIDITMEKIPLEEIFRLNNVIIKSKHEITDYTEEDLRVLSDIKTLRKYNFDDFNYLTRELSCRPDLTSVIARDNSSICWDREEKMFKCDFFHKGKLMTKNLKSPNVRKLLLNTGWFEYEVARFLSEWPSAKKVWMNIEFSTERLGDRPVNEVDIIVETEQKILFVEVKTKVFKPTDIDKFNDVVRNLGGLASKRIFITENAMDENASEKCNLNKIRHFAMSEIAAGESQTNKFFKTLDDYMKSINEK